MKDTSVVGSLAEHCQCVSLYARERVRILLENMHALLMSRHSPGDSLLPSGTTRIRHVVHGASHMDSVI